MLKFMAMSILECVYVYIYMYAYVCMCMYIVSMCVRMYMLDYFYENGTIDGFCFTCSETYDRLMSLSVLL